MEQELGSSCLCWQTLLRLLGLVDSQGHAAGCLQLLAGLELVFVKPKS